MFIVQDITTLRESVDDLENAVQDLQQFAYVTSHDMREPLRAIIGFSQVLLRDHAEQLDDEGTEMLQMVVDAGVRMRGILDATLELSRAGTQGMSITEVSISELVSELQTVLETELSDVELHIDIKHDVIYSDRWAVYLILKNLLTNAIKYAKPGVPPVVHIASTKVDCAVHISIEDNGVGIRDDLVPKIWMPFKRFAHQGDVPGSGVGLLDRDWETHQA